MVPYLLAVLFAYIFGVISSNAKKKWKKYFWAILAIIPLCVLAGFRDLDIGADTSNYPVTALRYSLSHGLFDSVISQQTEWLYSVCVWFISRICSEVWGVLLFTQIITVLPIVIVLIEKTPKRVQIGLTVYSLAIFCWSLNIMRQTAAASILLLAYLFTEKQNIKMYVISVFVSMSIHNMGVLGLMIWPIYSYFSEKNFRRKDRKFRNLFYGLGFFVLFAFIYLYAENIIRMVSLYKLSYKYQVRRIGEGTILTTFEIYMFVTFALPMIMCRVRGFSCIINRSIKSLSMILFISFLLSFLSMVSPALFRIGFMFSIFSPLSFCLALDACHSKINRLIFSMIVIVICLLLFFRAYVISGSAGAVPYHSMFLGLK